MRWGTADVTLTCVFNVAEDSDGEAEARAVREMLTAMNSDPESPFAIRVSCLHWDDEGRIRGEGKALATDAVPRWPRPSE